MNRQDPTNETLIAHALRGEGFDASEDGTGRGTPLVPTYSVCLGSDPIWNREVAMPTTTRNGDPGVIAFSATDHGADAGRPSPTLRAMTHAGSHANAGGQAAVAFAENQRAEVLEKVVVDGLKVGGGKPGQGYPAIRQAMQVRRLTPRECERLQGFPDDYTLVPYRGKPAADGPRYRALGNSMAVPCMRWLGERIQEVENLLKEMAA
jgi:DNA (cytosine-5)-methyltransferase 1